MKGHRITVSEEHAELFEALKKVLCPDLPKRKPGRPVIIPKPTPKAEPVKSDSLSEWWTIEQVAKYVGVEISSIVRWCKTKGFPSHCVSSKVKKFLRSEIDEWISAQKN